MSINNQDTSHFLDIDFEISSFIEHNSKLVSTMKIDELSSTLFTSNATIIRFCKKINLSGFNELKYMLKEELNKNIEMHNTFRKDVETSLTKYNDFIENIPIDDVLHIVDLICNEYPLVIHGRGLSAISAKYLYTILNSIDLRCIFIEDKQLIKSISHAIQKNSTLIIVSANPEYSIYEPIIRATKSNDVKIVLLTSNANNKVISLADIVLLTEDENMFYQQTDVNTRIGMITLIQILIELTCQRLFIKE